MGKRCRATVVTRNGAAAGKLFHVLPVFAKEAAHALDVPALQRFATSLQNDLSSKTIINILEAVFAVLRYAKKLGMRTTPVSLTDLTLKESETPKRPYFTSEQVRQIVGAAKEPCKTMFALASVMGARAGELMALRCPIWISAEKRFA
jgi:integrase